MQTKRGADRTALGLAADRLVSDRLRDTIAHLDVPPVEIEAQTAPSVDVIVPIHDAYDNVARCIAALVAYTDDHHRIVLVDDASQDSRIGPLLADVALRHPNLEVRRQRTNLGYLRTVNGAMRTSARDVILLNSDAIVGPSWLNRLARAANSHANIGIASPISDNATCLTICDHTELAKLTELSAQTIVQATASGFYHRVPVAVGYCMYIRRALIETIGVFDPAFDPAYGEETDYSLRAWEAGFEIVTCADAFVRHEGRASLGPMVEVRRRQVLHQRLMALRWPHYESSLQSWWRLWPLRQQAERIRSRLAANRPRLLHIAHARSRIGGTESHTRALSRTLATTYDNTLVAPELSSTWQDGATVAQGDSWRECVVNRHYHRSNQRFLGVAGDVSDPGVETQFMRFIVGGNYAIAHFHSLLHWNSLLLPFLAKGAGSKVVVTLHSLEALCPNFTLAPLPSYRPCGQAFAGAAAACITCLESVRSVRMGRDIAQLDDYLKVRMHLWRRILLEADAIIAPSRFVVERMAQAIDPSLADRVHLIPHGHIGTIERRAQSEDQTLRVGFFGGIAPTKGIGFVLELASRLQVQPARFELYGILPSIELPRHPPNVRRHGVYLPGTISRILSSIDVVLIPGQIEETFSLLLSECFAAAVPVIASQCGALCERIADGENGWLLEPDRLDDWEQKLLELMTPPGRAELQRISARLSMVPARSIEQNADEYRVVYESLLAGRVENHSLSGDPASHARLSRELGYRLRQPQERPYWLDFPLSKQKIIAAPAATIFVLIRVAEHNRHRIGETLDSVARALNAPSSAVVVAVEGVDQPDSQGVAVVDYRDVNAASLILQYVEASQSQWFIEIEAGDHLATSATRWLARCDDATNAVLADFDLVDERRRHYGAVAQRRWDPVRSLADTSYTRGLFLRTAVATQFLRSRHQVYEDCLQLQLYLRSVRASVSCLRQALVHVCDQNLSPDLRDVVINRRVRLVTQALEIEGDTSWQVSTGSAIPGWEITPIVPANESVCVICYGCDDLSEDAKTQLVRALGGWFSVEVHVLDMLTSIPDCDYVLLWRWGCRTRSGNVLSQLIAWNRLQDVAAVGPRRTDKSGAVLNRAYRYDGTSIEEDLDPVRNAGVSGESLHAIAGGVSTLFPECLLVRQSLLTLSDAHILSSGVSISASLIQQRWRTHSPHLVWLPQIAIEISGSRSFVESTGNSVGSTQAAEKTTNVGDKWVTYRRPGVSFEGLKKVRPRFALLTRDDWASSQYRIHQPFRYLFEEGLIDPPVVWRTRHERVPGVADVLAEDVDGIVLHHCFDDRSLHLLEALKDSGCATRLVVIDDFLEAIPDYNPLRKTVFPDIQKRVRRALASCSSLVATSQPLADVYGVYAPRTVVIENALPARPWTEFAKQSESRPLSSRIRIGWAGAGQHAADIAVLDTLLRAQTDVQWVFMGMAPAGAKDTDAEVHPPVPFDQYPEILAQLGLDAAVVPLVDNPFNRCKSFLKVLEFGALGVPVIASDIAPYQQAPALLISDPAQWQSAVADVEANPLLWRRRGESLRSWVVSNHQLEHRRAQWCSALSLRGNSD